jgi:hypothetical protein
MASVFGTKLVAHPSFTEPELIITIAQPSGYMDVLADRKPRVKIGPADKFVYVNRIDVRTQVAAQQATHNALPSATIVADFLQTATYRVRTRAEYSEEDTMDAGEWNVALPSAYRLAMRQGIFQYMRMAGLYGVNATNSEGLLNTPGATAVNLPPDPYGNTKISTYDAGALAIWLIGQVQAALQRMYLLGTATRVVLLGPQRIIGQMQLQNIVQLTSFQRAGGGTATTLQVIKEVLAEFGYEFEVAYDDTLIGQGAAGADALVLSIPEINVPVIDGVNTNEFAKLSPNISANTLQYADMAAPVEVTTPIPEGLDVVSSIRISSGWCIRGQGVTILSANY